MWFPYLYVHLDPSKYTRDVPRNNTTGSRLRYGNNLSTVRSTTMSPWFRMFLLLECQCSDPVKTTVGFARKGSVSVAVLLFCKGHLPPKALSWFCQWEGKEVEKKYVFSSFRPIDVRIQKLYKLMPPNRRFNIQALPDKKKVFDWFHMIHLI